jgi:multiple sugar transport system permease protein
MSRAKRLLHNLRWKRVFKSILFYILLLAVMIPFFIPFYWLLMTSLKNPLDMIAIPPKLFFQPTLQNYIKILADEDLSGFAFNSFIVATGACLIGMVFGAPAAFGIARYRLGKLSMLVLLARIIPGMSLLLPWFIVFSRMRLLNTHLSLILVHSIITLPLTVWILVSFFEDVPSELIDSALIDGCSITGAFTRIVMPITLPGTAVAFILGFVGSWNEFLFSIVLGGIRTYTLPVVAYRQIEIFTMDVGGVAAAAMVITLPVLLLTFAVQKHIVRGLTFGAVKG